MKKSALIIAAALIVFGIIVSVAALGGISFDLEALSNSDGEMTMYEISDKFESISISRCDTDDVVLMLSEDGKCKADFYKTDKEYYEFFVSEGTLNIKRVDNRRWYEKIGISFSFKDRKLTLYLPEAEYKKLSISGDTSDITVPEGFTFEDVDIKASTGDIKMEAKVTGKLSAKCSTGKINISGIDCESAELSTSTGDITVKSSDVKSLSFETDTGKTELTDLIGGKAEGESSTGDIILKNTVLSELCELESDTGDIKLDGFDAGSIKIETDTGDVRGSIKTDKVFIVNTDTGRINVPKTTSGGVCEITTDTGDIKIEIK